jgi:hypothetical protein
LEAATVYFVGFHWLAIRCAPAICVGVIYGVNLSRALLAASKPCAAAD